MPARLLDGAAVAQAIRAETRPAVDAFTARAGRPPGLGIVLVGAHPASELYVGNKVKSGGEAGLRVDLERLPEDASLADVLAGRQHRRLPRGRDRPERYCRKADGAAVVEPARDRNDLSFPHARPAVGCRPGRHSRGGAWTARVCHAGFR
jgi:hypothetical protein